MIPIDYQHFNSFNLTDPKTGITKNLTDDFGGIIININDDTYDRECMPQQNFITEKNDMIDGELFINSHYGVRIIDVTCLFSEENGGADLFELKRWLGKKKQQLFTWDLDDEDKGIYAIEQGGWQSQVYYGKKFYGKITFKFVCHNPYYFNMKDRKITYTNLVIGTDYVIRYRGNSDSLPLIKIVAGSPSINFRWNDLNITLSNLTNNPIYLDSEINNAYEMVNGFKSLVTYKYKSTEFIDFPEIMSEGRNSLTLLSGIVNSIEISPNTNII